MLNHECLEKFIKIYEREFGTELSQEDALRLALRLLEFYRLVADMPDVYSLKGNNVHNERR